MILYFNKYGQLLEKLEYGTAPRVGVENFQIFAYFEGLEDYRIATIRFRRPDLQGSEYPDLFMLKKNDFNYDPSVSSSRYFKTTNNPYSGFIFDFNDVMDGSDHVKLLDLAGMWQASITLYPTAMENAGSSVTGLVEFNVERAVSADDDDESEVGLNVIINNIRQLMEQIGEVENSGATNTDDKIYLIGAKEQAYSTKTYSNNKLTYQNGAIILENSAGTLETYYDASGIAVVGELTETIHGAARYNYPMDEGVGTFTLATREWTQSNVNDMINTATTSDIDSLFD